MEKMKLNIQMFANSGSLGSLSGSYKTTLAVSWSLLSQSVANNTSTIRLTEVFSTQNSTTISSSYSTFKLDGDTVYSGAYSKSGSGTIFTKTKDIVVKHNDDGSFPGRTVTYSTNDYIMGNQSGSGTIYAYDKDRHPEGVPSIPRTSVLSSATFSIASNGNSVTITPRRTKYSSSFYDCLTILDGSTEIATLNGVSNNTATALSSTQRTALFNAMKSIKEKTFSVYLTTYSSSAKTTKIGQTSNISVKATLPTYSLSFNTLSIEDTVTNYDEFKPSNSTFIRYLSKPKLTFNAISSTGSTYGNAISYLLSSSLSSTSSTVTSPYTVNNYTGGTYSVTATDGRVSSNKTNLNMSVVNYFYPTLNVDFVRTTSTGSTIDVSIDGKYYNGDGLQNILTPTFVLKYTQEGGEEQTVSIPVTTSTNGTEVSFRGTVQLTGMNYKKSVTWAVEVTDVVGYKQSATDKLTQGLPLWNGYKDGDDQVMNVNGGFAINNIQILDIIYPVGSLYLSVNNTNPSTLFGGTWKQIKDVFLLACGDTYKNGSTGGSSTVTIQQANLPSRTVVRTRAQMSSSACDCNKSTSDFSNHCLEDSKETYGQSMNIMPPFLAVYVWQRIA